MASILASALVKIKNYLVILSLSCTAAVWADDILVTAPRELENFSAGTHTTVIPVQDPDRGYRTLEDVLKQTSGVYTNQSYGIKDNGVSIRGFSNAQVKVLIDGVPFENAGLSFSLNEIPIEIIDKIIVSRGPMSSVYGNSAMGGVIDIITKKNYEMSKVSSSYGSFESFRLAGQTARSFDKSRIYLVSFYETTDGRYVIRSKADPIYDPGAKPETHTIQNNTQESYGGKLGFQYQKLYGSLTANQKNRGIPGLLEHPTPHIHERIRDYNLMLNFDEWVWIKDFHSDFMIFNRGNFTHYTDPLGEQNGAANKDTSKDRTWGAESKLKWFGLNTFVPSLRAQGTREDFSDSYLRKERETLMLSSSADYYVWNLIFTPSVSRTVASHLPQEQNYGLGTLYTFAPELSLKSQIGTSFRYPTFEELYLQRGFVVGNSDLQPEHSLGGDLGLSWQYAKFKGDLSYFQYWTDDLIDYQLVSGFQYKPYNFRSTQTRGWELDAKLGKFFSTDLGAAVTWQDIRDKDRNSPYYNNFIPMKPWLYGRVYLDYDLPIALGLHYVFTFAKSRFVNRSNTKKLADNYVSDLGFTSKFGHLYLLRFDVRNVFNRNNVDVRGVPLAGRAYYISLEKTFF